MPRSTPAGTSAAPPDPSRRPSDRLLILLLAGIQFTHIMDFMVMMPLGPQLMRIFGLTPDQFSLVVASYTFAAAASGLAGSLIIDRFDRRPALLFCYAGFLIGTLACALAPGFGALLVARIVSGMFGGVSGSLVMTIVADAVPLERRATAFGMVMASFSFASVAGVPTGLWLAATLSWHAPFFLIVAIGAVLWILAWARVPAMRGHLTEAGRRTIDGLAGLRELLTSPNTLSALALSMLLVLGHFVIIPFLSPSLVSNSGLQESELSWFYLAGGMASLITAPLIGRLADRFGRFLLLAVTIAGAIPTLYLITHLGAAPLVQILPLACALFSFGAGRFIPGQAIIASAVSPHLRGSFLSLNSSVRDLIAGVASLVGGHIVVREALTGKLLHFPVLGWIAIGASAVSLVVAVRVRAVS